MKRPITILRHDQSPYSVPGQRERTQTLARSTACPLASGNPDGVDQLGEGILSILQRFANAIFNQSALKVDRRSLSETRDLRVAAQRLFTPQFQKNRS